MFAAHLAVKKPQNKHRRTYIMSFITDEKAGRNAANIFWWFEGEFSKNIILSPRKVENEHIEGKDSMESIITETGLIGAHTEIKAMRNNNFVRRDNNPDGAPDPGGTLEFELWSNAWDKNNRLKPRKEWTTGWFPEILHPERYNTAGKTVVKPTRLVFMLCKDDEGRSPYACINFEKYDILEKRLYEIAPFDLDDIPSPLLRDYWKDEAKNTMFNCWYVSFDKVKDLATITRILDVPLEPEQRSGCPLPIQTSRCVNLLNSCNNPAFDRRVQFRRAQNAARAYNKDRGLPDDAPLLHMTQFNSDKLPPYVRQYGSDELPEWIQGIGE